MRASCLLAAWLSAVLCAPGSAGAIPVPPVKPHCLTLGLAIEGALEDDPRIDIASAARQAARADAMAAYSRNYPRIGLFGRTGFGDTQPLDVTRDDQFGVQATLDIYSFGQRRAAQLDARAQLEAARHGVGEARLDVGRAAALAFVDVLRAEALMALSRERAAAFAEDAATADRRLRSRAITLQEASRLKSRTAIARAEETRAAAALDKARLRLEILARRKPGCLSEDSLFERLSQGSAELLLLPPEDVLRRARMNSPALKRAEAGVAAAQAGMREAQRANLPTVSANAFTLYQHNSLTGELEDESRVGLSVSQQLFAGGENRARRLGAQARLRGARAEERLERLNLEDGLMQALAEARAALEIKDQLGEARQQARVQLEATRAAYDRGALTMTELILAIEAFQDAAIREADARFAYHASLIELQTAFGTLTDEGAGTDRLAGR